MCSLFYCCLFVCFVFDSGEIVLACFLINTCEYVVETLPGLATRVSGMIDTSNRNTDSNANSSSSSTTSSSSPSTIDQSSIDLTAECELFSAAINHAVQVLVGSMWSKLNRVLSAMTKLPWATWNSVGDESPYVQQVAAILREELPIVAAHLSPRYAPFFCNQIASTFIPRYVDAIYKCRRIGETGAQQMSLDAHSLKNVLLQVPNLTAQVQQGTDGKARTVQNRSYQK